MDKRLSNISLKLLLVFVN